jgi:hypothetical protein
MAPVAINSSVSSQDFSEEDFSGLYYPDFTLVRMQTKHTKRTATSVSFEGEPDIEVSCDRPKSDVYGEIPITEVDCLLTSHQICTSQIFNIGKNNTFNTMIPALEEVATEIKKSFCVNDMRDVTTYKVPVTGFYKKETRDYDLAYRISYPKYIPFTNKVIPDSSPRERIVVINGETYSNFRTYKRSGTGFVPLNFRLSPDISISETEQIFRPSKKSMNRDSITFSFGKHVSISSLVLHPEAKRYEYVHSTILQCRHNCLKSRHCICVLKNDPQFISKFELHYRSENTNGQWVKHGVFAGCTSMNDDVRINFDEIKVKELRVIPVIVHNGFDKTKIDIVGNLVNDNPVSDDLFVTYTIRTPRDGQYTRRYDKTHCGITGYIGCDCSLCTGRRIGKGMKKIKHREFTDACDF